MQQKRAGLIHLAVASPRSIAMAVAKLRFRSRIGSEADCGLVSQRAAASRVYRRKREQRFTSSVAYRGRARIVRTIGRLLLKSSLALFPKETVASVERYGRSRSDRDTRGVWMGNSVFLIALAKVNALTRAPTRRITVYLTTEVHSKVERGSVT